MKLALRIILILLLFSLRSMVAYAQDPNDTVDHAPRFLPFPVECFEGGGAYRTWLGVTDYDLYTSEEVRDTVRVRVIDPPGFTVEPSVFAGTPGQEHYMFSISSSQLPGKAGKLRVVLEARDAQGHSEKMSYQIYVSDPAIFSMPVTVRNNKGAEQTLIFGTAPTTMATIGSDADQRGHLDENYCEYDLPPTPPGDVFDVRWMIPGTNGTQRNIYPVDLQNGGRLPPWHFHLKMGDPVTPNTLPISIRWSMRDAARSPHRLYISDPQGKLVQVDMATGAAVAGSGIMVRKLGEDTMEIVAAMALEDFFIRQDLPGIVEPAHRADMLSLQIAGNPFIEETAIRYFIQKREEVHLEIYDVAGRLVRRLLAATRPQGSHSITWDGRDDCGKRLPSGSYTCRLSAGGSTISRTVVMVR